MATESNQAEPTSNRTQARFTFTSILVFMTVFGAVAMSFGHLWQAANGDRMEIGYFVVTTAISPLLMLVIVSFVFRVIRFFSK